MAPLNWPTRDAMQVLQHEDLRDRCSGAMRQHKSACKPARRPARCGAAGRAHAAPSRYLGGRAAAASRGRGPGAAVGPPAAAAQRSARRWCAASAVMHRQCWGQLVLTVRGGAWRWKCMCMLCAPQNCSQVAGSKDALLTALLPRKARRRRDATAAPRARAPRGRPSCARARRCSPRCRGMPCSRAAACWQPLPRWPTRRHCAPGPVGSRLQTLWTRYLG